MGNETQRPKRNKNSYSMDFGHDLPDKIKPANQYKLEPINDNSSRLRESQYNSKIGSRVRSEVRKSPEENSKDNSQHLAKLNLIND